MLLTLHSYIGLKNRQNLSAAAYDTFTGFADTKFYLSKWKFVCKSRGDRLFNPFPLFNKIINMYWCGGMYSHKDGDIHINLQAIQRQLDKEKFWRGFNPKDPDEAVVYIIEHEALHSAIRSHSKVVYKQKEGDFNQKWENAEILEKIKIFYSSLVYGFGGGVPWNEEWIIKQIQDAKRSNREIQKIRSHVLPDLDTKGVPD